MCSLFEEDLICVLMMFLGTWSPLVPSWTQKTTPKLSSSGMCWPGRRSVASTARALPIGPSSSEFWSLSSHSLPAVLHEQALLFWECFRYFQWRFISISLTGGAMMGSSLPGCLRIHSASMRHLYVFHHLTIIDNGLFISAQRYNCAFTPRTKIL